MLWVGLGSDLILGVEIFLIFGRFGPWDQQAVFVSQQPALINSTNTMSFFKKGLIFPSITGTLTYLIPAMPLQSIQGLFQLIQHSNGILIESIDGLLVYFTIKHLSLWNQAERTKNNIQ